MVGSDLAQLFDHLPAGIYRTTACGRVVAANRMLVEMLGYASFDELAARGHHDGVWHRADGSVAKLRENVRAVRGAGGAIEFYEGIVETVETADAILTIDSDGRVLDVNPRLVALFGVTGVSDALTTIQAALTPRSARQLDAFLREPQSRKPIRLFGKTGRTFSLIAYEQPQGRRALSFREAAEDVRGPAVRPLVTLLGRAAKTLLSADEANRFLCRVLSAALHATGAPYGLTLFPTAERTAFRVGCTKHTGFSSGAVIDVGHEIASVVARGVPAIVDGVPFAAGAANTAPRVCIAPLTVDGRTLAVLCLGIADPRDFHGEDLGTLAAFATIAALAIDRWTQFDRLAESETRYRSLVENAHDPIVMTDGSKTIVYVNPAVQRVFGFEPAELLQQPLRTLVPDEGTGITRAGARVPLEVSAGHVSTSTTWILRDASTRKLQAEEQETLTRVLKTVAREWVATFDAVEAPMLILDASDLTIRRLNRAARELFGASYGELVGRGIDELATVEPWLSGAELCRRASVSGQTETTQLREETSPRSPGASPRTWDLTVTGANALIFPREEPFLILILHDITRLVELQEQNRRSEMLGALGAIVGGVAHEVRNPLFAISATLEAFEKETEGREEFAEYVTIFRGELDRLSMLMKDLLAFGKPPSQTHRAGSLTDVIFAARQQCIGEMQARGVSVEVSAAGDVMMIMDEQRMTQLFQNVIENAVQHSPAGSHVDVRVYADPDSPHIHCQVVDAGPGFAPADLPRVFEPFFSRRNGGTGLGLSLVQRIVEEHRGSIAIANGAHGGAVADILFPAGAR